MKLLGVLCVVSFAIFAKVLANKNEPIVGAFGHVGPCTPYELKSLGRAREDIKFLLHADGVKGNKDYFDAIECSEQIVGGINIWAKIQINQDAYIHVEIYVKAGRKKVTIVALQTGKTKNDPLLPPGTQASPRNDEPLMGGFGPVGQCTKNQEGFLGKATADIKAILKEDGVQGNKAYFEAIECSEQRVEGFNIWAKIQINKDAYIHVEIYAKQGRKKVTVVALETGKSKDAPLLPPGTIVY